MKRNIITFIMVVLPLLVLAQLSPDQNYTYSKAYKVATQSESPTESDEDKIESVTYYDGLGRPVQSKAYKGGGNGSDIITHMSYDDIGRQDKTYLPYAAASNSLGYTAGAEVATVTYYNTNYAADINISSPNPYSEVDYEASPLNRVLQQAAPGEDWSLANNHTIKMGYDTNIASEVKHYKVTFASGDYTAPTLVYVGDYAVNELYKSTIKDENWQINQGKSNTTEEFKDKLGRVILKRTYIKENNVDVALDTQYVYDDHSNLTYVLSPEGSASILNNGIIDLVKLDELCYQYKYDYRNRLIEKKLPQKGWEYIVYDALDRPTLTQDQNQKANNEWLFTKYDAFGRVIYTGIYSSSETRAQVQTQVNARATHKEVKLASPITINGTTCYHDNKIFPKLNIDLLTINYYDDYNFDTTLAYQASSAIVNETPSYLTISNGVITKTSGNGWSASITTQATIPGDGAITYTATGATDKQMAVGLTEVSANTNHSYLSMSYAIFTGLGTQSRVYIYESGVAIYIPVTTYQTGDVFKIERIGTTVYYKKNGEVFYISTNPSTGTLVGDSSFLNQGASIANVQISYNIEDQPITTQVQGLVTGSKVRVLDTNDWITSVTHYDAKARPVYVASQNDHLGTTDVVKSQYDFIGNVLSSTTTHDKTGASTIVTEDFFTYDHQNRLLRQDQRINSGELTTIYENTYDALGQLQIKKTGVQHHSVGTALKNEQNVVKDGDYIFKGGQVGSWNDGAFESEQEIVADGYMSYTITEAGKNHIIGLSDVNQPDSSGTGTIDHAIYCFGNRVYIRENGLNKLTTPTIVNFVVGDELKVERVGNTIYYKKNEVVIGQTTVSSIVTLVGDGCLYLPGSYIKDFRVVAINVNQGNALQTVDYSYNIRGWLKGINDVENLGDDLFTFKINYNDAAEGTATAPALYNGNISQTIWKTTNDDKKRSYAYNYDNLNRIKEARYRDGASLSENAGVLELYGLNYDKNGNITSLERNAIGASVMDNLTYTYTGNQLQSVTDSSLQSGGFNDGNTIGNDYSYDVNGNMTLDKNKNITGITYNHLNLPKQVTFSFPNAAANEVNAGVITYTYDATGVKLAKEVTQSSVQLNIAPKVTQYAGNYIYEGNSSATTALVFFNHPEGYVEPVSGKTPINPFVYIYQYKDHLGNIRLAYADDDRDGKIDVNRSTPTGFVDVDGDGDHGNELREENNYYPFGLKHKGYNNVITGRDHKYGFGGKEYNDELGLDTYDFGARNYMADLGRWGNIDPLAEQMRRHSPYNFAFDNPIYWTDPDGMAPQHIGLGKNTVANRNLNQKEIKGLMGSLQAMTNDKLSYNSKTGRVEIASKGSGKLSEGTSLIRNLIGSDKTTTINLARDGKYGMPGAAAGAAEGDTVAQANHSNGVGADTEVDIGVGHTYTAQDFETGEFSTETMTDTNMLNHELTHALAQTNGESKDGTTVHYYTDSNGTQREKINKEEAYTVGFEGFNRPVSPKTGKYPTENSLNKEQGGKRRVNYGFEVK